MTVQKLIDMLNRIPDKNLIVEVECWGEGSVPATDVSIMDHDEPEYHVDDNGDDIKFTDYVLIDGQWGVKDAPQIGVSTNYVERHPDIYDQIKQLTTKNDLGVDTDKLIADCEKMSFDFELFGRPTKALLLDAVKNIVKDLPSVTPQEPRCKDCKWWKDSDGKYRRGCGTESQCPINTHAVYYGEGYCYMFSPKAESESQESEEV